MKEKSATGYRRSWSNPGPDDLQRPNTLRLCSGKIERKCSNIKTLRIFAASSSISLTTPATPGESLVKNNKLDNIKKWTISTYKCSRQSLYEKLGKTSRTVDPELDEQIETLRDTQRKYSNILRLAKTLSGHFFNMVQTQVVTVDKLNQTGSTSNFYGAELSWRMFL